MFSAKIAYFLLCCIITRIFGDVVKQQKGVPDGYANFLRAEICHGNDSISRHELVEDGICESRDKLSCLAKCEHVKIFFVDGCCQCLCRMNYAPIDSTRCREASWTGWSVWSKCTKTEWGGLQTRERVCESNGSDAPGACVGEGSRWKNCSPVTSEFRIRKNLRELTDEEVHDMIQGMNKFKLDNSSKGYTRIAQWHGVPGLCPWYHHFRENNHCSFHRHPLFLPWHRMLTIQFELGLQRHLKNKTLGIPYWDWTEHDVDLPYLIRHQQIYDPVLKKYVRNPFYRSLMRDDKGKFTFTHRRPWLPGILDDNLLRKGSVRGLQSHDYQKFDYQITNAPHDQVHNCMCVSHELREDGQRWCLFGVADTPYSAWDPVFLIHHSSIDRIFTMRRVLEENAGVADWTKNRVIGQMQKAMGTSRSTVNDAFEFPLSPFCNKSMNPETITLRDDVWTMHKSFYEEPLFGYKYSSFDLGNYPWETMQRDFKHNNIDREYWNDDLLETELGGLTRRFCEKPYYDEDAECQLRC